MIDMGSREAWTSRDGNDDGDGYGWHMSRQDIHLPRVIFHKGLSQMLSPFLPVAFTQVSEMEVRVRVSSEPSSA